MLGVWYIICATAVSVAPNLAAKLFGWMVHLTNITPAEITTGGFVAGFVQVVIYTYISAWVFAWLHNRFLKPRA